MIKKKTVFFQRVIIVFICLILSTSFWTENDGHPSCSELFKDYHFPTPEQIYAFRERIDAIIEQYDDFEFNIGLSIISLDKPLTFYERNIDDQFVPASNLKIITSAVALELLTPDFRWETAFYINDENYLFVKATGDPTWNNRFIPGIIDSLMSSIADSLRDNNITEVF